MINKQMAFTSSSLPVLKTPSLHAGRYLRTLSIVFLCVLFPIFAANLYLNYIDLCDVNSHFEASRWQQKTRGVACTGAGNNREFKTLRLEEGLKEKNERINAVAFGSSTLMGMTADAAPSVHLYNFSQSSNVLPFLVSGLEHLVQHKEVTSFIVPIDWAIRRPPQTGSTTAEEIKKQRLPSWKSLVQDALSTSKVNVLINTVHESIVSHSLGPLKIKFGLNREDYSCKSGEIAKDFSSPFPRKCAGFHYDGSCDFSHYIDPLTASKAAEALRVGSISASIYITNLRVSKELLSRELLSRVSAVIKKIKIRKADIFFILPPLLPGLEKKILTMPEGEILRQLKAALHKFATENQVQILDAGQSENYGCHVSEFIDGHHALPACHKKIMTHFYKHREKGKYGLISLSGR